MNAKTVKLYEYLIKFNENDFLVRKNSAFNFANSLLEIDFEYGLDACYYLFLKQEKLFEYEGIRNDITITILNKLLEKNRQKAIKAILSSPVLLKGFYTLNSHAYEGETLEILASLLASNKLGDADLILKAAFKNNFAPFGEGMVSVFEGYIKKLPRAQEGSLKPQMNKKTANFLLGYIDRIKGSEKPLLVQRIKELL